MAVERCKICNAPRSGEAAGEHGFCTTCLGDLTTLGLAPQEALKLLSRPHPHMEKALLLKWLQGQSKQGPKSAPSKKKPSKKGSGGAQSSSSGVKPVAQAKWLQHEVDALYRDRLQCFRLRIAVQANESGGFGDLINCLNTSQILTGPKDKWRAYASCNHTKFDQMLKSFPKVRELESASGLVGDASWVLLHVISRGGSVAAGCIDEYGYQSEKDAEDVFSRGAGLAPHEIGIMINPTLRTPLPLASLRLASTGLQHFLGLAAQVTSHRLFFGYGAGQKSPDCFHVLLDRVLFDDSISSATILPVGHNEGHLEAYLNSQDRWKALQQGVTLEKWKSQIKREQRDNCLSLGLPLKNRSIQLLFPVGSLDYTDMLQLWRAADRSFTICEGDQSFSEAISAGIPMAYQLWNPQQGSPHKTRLFEDLLACCHDKSEVETFLRACKDYGRKKFDLKLVTPLIQTCNNAQFIQKYVACMDWIAAERNIANALPGFIKRLWLRKVRELGVAPHLNSQLDELFHLEDSRAPLETITSRLFQLHVAIKELAASLSWRPETDTYLRTFQPRPSDLNYLVASTLASIESITKKKL